MARQLLLGSNNVKKRDEIRVILEGLDFAISTPQDLGITDEPEETGGTFLENATIKARYYARASGFLTLADDSGLIVDALEGRPGVRSSRYAADEMHPNATRGEVDAANCDKLLAALVSVPDAQRTARFQCSIVVVEDDDVRATALGTCEGIILREKSGDGGFGYDPLFYYAPAARSFAQLPAEIKNSVSHRARALRQIRSALEAL